MLNIQLDDPQRLEDLVVFPLLSAETVDLPYDILAEGVAAGTVRVREVGHGTVPTLQVQNLGERAILILDGEQLIGARQNRTTNRSILVAAATKAEIPVSCMEEGRWHFRTPEFQSGRDHAPAKVRRRAREVEHEHVRTRRSASPAALAQAQGAVWGEISALSAKLGVRSSTGALDEAYTARRLDLDKWAGAFPVVDGQVGLLALTPRGAVGLDVVGSPALYGRLHARLLNGYLMDGLDCDAVGRTRPYRFAEGAGEIGGERPGWEQRAARRFMRSVMQSERLEAPTVGLGAYSVLSRTVVGGELVDEERLVHLSAFPVRDVARPRGPRRRL